MKNEPPTPAPVDLEELRAVAEKATKGPWQVESWMTNSVPALAVVATEGHEDGELTIADFPAAEWKDEAAFIATFDPPTVLALLSEIESLRSDRERLEGDLQQAEGAYGDLFTDTALQAQDFTARLTRLERIADAARRCIELQAFNFGGSPGPNGATNPQLAARDALAAALNQEAPDGE